MPGTCELLIIEPFYGGSHKYFIDVLLNRLKPDTHHLATLPDCKWHWKARASALNFSQTIPLTDFSVILASSVLNLTELVGLRPDLANSRKVVYFHENQLEYPIQDAKDRDCQYGYNQILSCLTADVIIFNSQYNLSSFVSNIPAFLHKIPSIPFDADRIRQQVSHKSTVLPVPIEFRLLPQVDAREKTGPLRIVWPHRWEHDKNPALLKRIVTQLAECSADIQLSILGEQSSQCPPEFAEIRAVLGDKVIHFGYVESKVAFYRILAESDVVLSTADHEFQGLSVQEAIHYGCYPLCPKRLVYPEYLPDRCLYSTERQAVKLLAYAAGSVHSFRRRTFRVDLTPFSWDTLGGEYARILLPPPNR